MSMGLQITRFQAYLLAGAYLPGDSHLPPLGHQAAQVAWNHTVVDPISQRVSLAWEAA